MFNCSNNNNLVQSIKLITAYYPSSGTAVFADYCHYSIPIIVPSGYTAIWAWTSTEGFVGSIYSNWTDQNHVSVWTVNNCAGESGRLLACVLCVKSSMVG